MSLEPGCSQCDSGHTRTMCPYRWVNQRPPEMVNAYRERIAWRLENDDDYRAEYALAMQEQDDPNDYPEEN